MMTSEDGTVTTRRGKSVRENSGARKIFWNFGFLTLGRASGDIFTFLFFVILSRAFGQDGIGQYSFAMGFAGFFVVFCEFGLYHFTIKELSRRTDSLGDYYDRIFSLRLILLPIVFFVLLITVSFLTFPHETKLIIILIGISEMINRQVEGFGAVFIAHEDAHLVGLLEFSLKAAAALVGIAAVLSGVSLVVVLTALPVVAAAQLLVAYSIVSRKYGRPRLRTSWSSLTYTMREAAPYALSVFLFQLYSRVNIVLLGFFLGVAATGIYNVAYRVIFILTFIPQFAMMAMLPLASRLYTNSMEQLRILYHKALNLIVLVGVPIAAGVWLIAPDLTMLVFGETFVESAPVLRLLAGLIFLTFLSRTMGTFLISCDRQVERTRSQWIVAWVNVLGNLVLIPVFGIEGAATAMLISETLLVCLFAVRLKAILGWPQIGPRLAISGIATASFCLPFTFFPPLSLWMVVLVSMLLYTGILVLFKETRENEVHMFVSLLKGA